MWCPPHDANYFRFALVSEYLLSKPTMPLLIRLHCDLSIHLTGTTDSIMFVHLDPARSAAFWRSRR